MLTRPMADLSARSRADLRYCTPGASGRRPFDVSVATSCLLAGSAAVVQVLQKLAAASIDGNLTKDEIDAAFGIKAETRAAHDEAKAAK